MGTRCGLAFETDDIIHTSRDVRQIIPTGQLHLNDESCTSGFGTEMCLVWMVHI
jgi:hypothetical protein